MRLRKGTASAWMFVATTSSVVAVCIVIGVLRSVSDCAELRPRLVPSCDARHVLAENVALYPERVVNLPRVEAVTYQQRDVQVASRIFEGGVWGGTERIVTASQVLLDKVALNSSGSTTSRPAGVMCDPQLQVRKLSVSSLVDPGGRIIYTICLSNTGSAPATSVVVTDVHDAGVHFCSALPKHSSGDGGVRVWEFPQLRAGCSVSIVITATASSALTNGLLLTNVVYARSQEVSVISSTAVVTVSAPTLSVDKTDSPDPVAPGGLLTYTIVYSNSGSADATRVCVQEFYGDLTGFERADPPSEPGCSDRWCHDGELSPDGKNHSITVTVRVSDSASLGTVLSNTVFLYSSEWPPVSKTITTSVDSHYVWLPVVRRNYCRLGPWWCPSNDQNLRGRTVFALARCSNGTLFAGAEDGVYHRAPGDVRWQQEVSTTGEVRGLAASSDCSAVYAAVLDQGILSRDGVSWTLVSTPEMTQARTVVLAGGKVLAGGDFGVEYSSVGPSHHWESCGARLDGKSVTSLVRSDGAVYVAVWCGGIRRFPEYDCRWLSGHPWDDLGKSAKCVLQAIGSSTDGEPEFAGMYESWYRWAGDKWERCGDVRTFCFAIDDTTVYAGQERSGVLRSTDDGVTWKQMNNGWGPPLEVRALLIHVDGDSQRWLYAGTTEGVWRYLLD